jgi:GAF domain-containing protein
MPYVQCPSCDLTTYVARSHVGFAECPRCATPLHVPQRRFARDVPPATLDREGVFEDGLLHALALARRQLGMELAFLGELRNGEEVLRWLSGDAASFGFREELALPLAESYCRTVLTDGAGVVRDAREDERVSGLEVTSRAGIGSYVGVRLEPVGGRRFVLCCISHDARDDLGDEEMRFLRGVAETVVATLEAQEASDQVTAAWG